MRTFLKITSILFYLLAISAIGFFLAYWMGDSQNETYYKYFLYSGFGAIGLSIIRTIMRFI